MGNYVILILSESYRNKIQNKFQILR